MRTKGDRERSYRRAVAAGVLVSIAAHVAVLAYGSILVRAPSESGRSVRLVQLEDIIERNVPLEVVQLRVQNEFTDTAAGSASSLSPQIPQRVSAPTFVSVHASLSLAIPNPLALLRVLEVEEKPENPVASYANISDFAVDASANPRPLRSMDDRPVGVLAALASVANGSGATIGGGHCPSPGIFR
ncbi:MAG: hypothetical protein V3S56_04295 [Gemmatimonadota bacterium]